MSGPAPRLRNIETFPVEQDGERYLALRDPAGYTPAVVLVPLGLLQVLALFDCERDVAAIQA